MESSSIVLSKHDGEEELDFLMRIGSAKENGEIDVTWEQIADFINAEFRTQEVGYRTESAYRKKYNKLKFSNGTDIEPRVSGTDALLRKIERQKIQYRDERRAWQQQNYISARVENKLDLLEEKLLEQGRVNFEKHSSPETSADNDVLLVLSDLHIGQTFKSAFGEYNSTVAKERLERLLNEVIEIGKTHNSENCYVSLTGDLLSGNIHKTIQVSNRENVIEQIKMASELISSFCYELTKHFKKVFLSSVNGNHSRIDKKEEAIHDERLDDIIAWGVELTLRHVDNFCVLHSNIDSGIAVLNIRGRVYVAVHGDMDRFTDNGVSKLCLYLGHVPYAVIMGHLHTCALDEVNDVKMIRGGSLAGSGDSYTIEKRLSGRPSQMICVCNNNGIRCCYPIDLSLKD